jgi:hypothetical protein
MSLSLRTGSTDDAHGLHIGRGRGALRPPGARGSNPKKSYLAHLYLYSLGHVVWNNSRKQNKVLPPGGTTPPPDAVSSRFAIRATGWRWNQAHALIRASPANHLQCTAGRMLNLARFCKVAVVQLVKGGEAYTQQY